MAHLKKLLIEDILPEEMAERRRGSLPTEAAPPQNLKREDVTLGTVDADAAVIERRALFSTEELKRKAELAEQRRIAAGISDAVENEQGLEAPAFDQAVALCDQRQALDQAKHYIHETYSCLSASGGEC